MDKRSCHLENNEYVVLSFLHDFYKQIDQHVGKMSDQN